MSKPVFHCLFEQSGTFKNELRDMGFVAYDYDISDKFGETDYMRNLFDEIRRAYFNCSSIFDLVGNGDFVLAFFPCVRFSSMFTMYLSGDSLNLKGKSDMQKVEIAHDMHSQLSELYEYFCMMFVVAYRKGFKMVVENPFQGPHYLKANFPIKPSLVIHNRRELGDYYEKPTQFWFVNFSPLCNVFFEAIEWYEKKTIGLSRGFDRSRISPCFASFFLRRYVIPSDLLPAGYEYKGGELHG